MVARPLWRYVAAMNSNMKRFVAILIASALLALFGTACNTSQGFGKDVEKLGDKIQEKAR